MKLNWKIAESTVKPIEFDDKSSPFGVYIRKDIVEVKTDDHVSFKYHEVFLTKEDYEQYRISLIVQELMGIEQQSESYKEYLAKMNMPIEYPINNHLYKPKWAQEIYVDLISKMEVYTSFQTIAIWDATGAPENVVDMNINQLKELTSFLGKVQEQYYNEYKYLEATNCQ